MTLTPICTIDRTGIHRPTLADCLNYFYDTYRSIYGQDIYIDPDSQDGQFLGLLATALDDTNAETVAAYNAFSPTTAQGVGLSSVVKINGIARKVPSYSTVHVTITGTVGTSIDNGVVQDDEGQYWNLPASVVIPSLGTIDVTATAQEIGDVRAAKNSVNSITTPVPGWQTVSNSESAVTGMPVETDAELRIRQAFSASLPAKSNSEALLSAIAAIQNVRRYKLYENNGPAADSYGVPGHSIALAISGGGLQELADTLALKKAQGVNTYGKMSVLTTADSFGIQRTISFSLIQDVPISFKLKIKPLAGFTYDIQNSIRESLTDWVNSLDIGQTVYVADAYMAARLYGSATSKTFSVVPDSLLVARDGQEPTATDISMEFDEAPQSLANYVTLVLVKT